MFFILFFVGLTFVLASLLSVYSYGQFARQAKGEHSEAIPATALETKVDYWIVPQTDQHPAQTGMVILSDNLNAFAARALTAQSAGRSLDLQYYIWHEDLTGHLLAHELFQAAERGVRVRLLIDDLNIHGRTTSLAALEHHPNIAVRLFNPARGGAKSFRRGFDMLLRFFRMDRRMHNKAWIVDNRIAIVGGRNIGDEYFGANHHANFLDTDVAVIGAAVSEASAIFDAFWNSHAVIPLQALVHINEKEMQQIRQRTAESYQNLNAKPYLERLRESASTHALFRGEHPLYWTNQAHIYSDPPEKVFGQGDADWLIHRLAPVLFSPTQALHLISPYFVPGKEGLKRLLKLVDQRVAISVLTNSLSSTNQLLVHGGYARYRLPLAQAGVRIYELMKQDQQDKRADYQLLTAFKATLHTKAFTVDGEQGFIGSFNLDPRSAQLNTEMGILFDAPIAVQALLNQIHTYEESTRTCYQVFWQQGRLSWKDHSVMPPRIWTAEPQTSFYKRCLTKIIGWLPIESQL